METFRAKQLDMLCELDYLCRTNDIPYILSGYTARAAVRHHMLPQMAVVPTVCMRYADAVRLSKLVQTPDRRMESALANRRISRMVMRYSHTGTTCLRVDEWNSVRYPGICVEIELMRPVPGKGVFNKLFKMMEAEAALSAGFRCLSGGWRALLAVLVPLEKLALRMAYTGYPFGGSNLLRVARFPKKSVEIPASLLDERQEVEVAGKKLFVSRDVERYLSVEFEQTRPQDDPERMLDDLAMTVIDTQMPCAQALELVRELYGKGPDVNWIHRSFLRGRMRSLRKKIQKYWDLLAYTRDRFDLWKQLMPQKDHICQLYRAGDTQAICAVLKPYLTALDRNLAKGFALCFDEELFNIALSLLEADGRRADAQRLRALVFPEHLKPMIIEGFEHD